LESLFGEAEVSALETSVPVGRGRNFSSAHWIAVKFLQEFPDAVFLAVDVKSLFGEAEVSSLETRVPVPKGRNFRFDRRIALKFLQEIPQAIYLE